MGDTIRPLPRRIAAALVTISTTLMCAALLAACGTATNNGKRIVGPDGYGPGCTNEWHSLYWGDGADGNHSFRDPKHAKVAERHFAIE